MKKAFASLVLSAALVSAVGCSNWNRATPGPLDNTAIESEIRKNLAGDHITGLQIEAHDGMVTLNGHGSAADRQKAYDDAAKVNGVKSVTNNIAVQSNGEKNGRSDSPVRRPRSYDPRLNVLHSGPVGLAGRTCVSH